MSTVTFSTSGQCRLCGEPFRGDDLTLRTLRPWGLVHAKHIPEFEVAVGQRNDTQRVLDAHRAFLVQAIRDEALQDAGAAKSPYPEDHDGTWRHRGEAFKEALENLDGDEKEVGDGE
ncbi:hypothetical protein [Kineosporia succinea]|uniref:Uncharacterized protein n=1 Tax=Kineosporia succinea TaxID=84632 RepID=A0ABT9P9I5_9ACTN|nr:hypothetical protein [Kineosporia succinea]MDP9829363.1 hypothetical protein [Kineosporia succinea]